MSFSARNARYLRISAHTVLPLYIYLDDKHVEWMTDYILQCVLEDLRPVYACFDSRPIGPKLHAESNLQSTGGSSLSAKKGTVDVHRGDTYQFAYFIRKNEPHAILIKSRDFVPSPSLAEDTNTPVVNPPLPSSPSSRPKGRKGSKIRSKASYHARPKNTTRVSDSDEDMFEDTDGVKDVVESSQGRNTRSLRKRSVTGRTYRETDGEGDDDITVNSDDNATEADQNTAAEDDSSTTTRNAHQAAINSDPESAPIFDIDAEDEEEKPKLSMRVTYQGFTIYDRCLCVIIEPWTAIKKTRSVAPSLAEDADNSRELPERIPTMASRERTPLFLPELDPRRSITPAPLPSRFRPPVPLFDGNTEPEVREDVQEDIIEEDGMMAFSQALKSVRGERAGSADGDDNEGDVFLGDADERRGDL